jgi:putative endonuclease
MKGKVSNWFVYILRCGDGTYYTGITNNVEKRLEAHRSGKGAKYTRGRLPLTLEVYRTVESKSEALKLEYKVKKIPKNKKIEYLRDGGIINK